VTEYSVTLADSVGKELRKLPSQVIERVQPKIRELAGNPRPPGCQKLHGYKNCWRIRVGDYRIVYTVDDFKKLVDITRVAHRSGANER
jgi:mRNA interferase RelE/StbE